MLFSRIGVELAFPAKRRFVGNDHCGLIDIISRIK